MRGTDGIWDEGPPNVYVDFVAGMLTKKKTKAVCDSAEGAGFVVSRRDLNAGEIPALHVEAVFSDGTTSDQVVNETHEILHDFGSWPEAYAAAAKRHGGEATRRYPVGRRHGKRVEPVPPRPRARNNHAIQRRRVTKGRECLHLFERPSSREYPLSMPRRKSAIPPRMKGMPGPVICRTCLSENSFLELSCVECGTSLSKVANEAPSLSAVASSNVDAIGYDSENHALYVRFLNGGIYTYLNVPPETYRDFTEADSKGSFLAREIKGVFPYEKIQ